MKFLSFPIDLLPVDSLLSSAPHLMIRDFVLRTSGFISPGIEFCYSIEFLLFPPHIDNLHFYLYSLEIYSFQYYSFHIHENLSLIAFSSLDFYFMEFNIFALN